MEIPVHFPYQKGNLNFLRSYILAVPFLTLQLISDRPSD
jgi:hypothetical protein